MKIHRIKLYSAILLAATIATGCTSTIGLIKNRTIEATLTMPEAYTTATHISTDQPIAVAITSSVSSDQMYNTSDIPSAKKILVPDITFIPSLKSFATSATTTYMRKTGFDISQQAEYILHVNISRYQLSVADINNEQREACISMSYTMTDPYGETIIPSHTITERIRLTKKEQPGEGMGRVFVTALENIEWNEIARALTVTANPSDSRQKTVKGNGDTALEHTVIRWFITSNPQGADVSWRLISSTPDVSNTNSNFVGSTPYETTESFDIKGLSYGNAGNVQIEITCERSGYLPQKKRFNLKQAIDQKEISAKFNLIKDE